MRPKASKVSLDRTSVVQAAVELLDSIAPEEVTLTQLASHLNVRVPSLYNHIAGLPGLKREFALFGVREMVKRMGPAVMGKAGDDAIRALAHSYRGFVKEHPGLYSATLRAPAPDDVELQVVARELIDIILRTLSFYGLHDDDALHTVRELRSIIHGFATLENAGGFEIPIAPDETFRRLISMFLASLNNTRSM
jgi:AcrR family transcriptional regulator